jgi:hypothetical protein
MRMDIRLFFILLGMIGFYLVILLDLLMEEGFILLFLGLLLRDVLVDVEGVFVDC